MMNKTLAQRNDNPLSPSKYSSDACLNFLRYFGEFLWGISVWVFFKTIWNVYVRGYKGSRGRDSCCLLGQAPCPYTTGRMKKTFEAQVLVQEHNGDRLPLMQHEQIRWEIIKPEENTVVSLTCMNMGHPIPAN